MLASAKQVQHEYSMIHSNYLSQEKFVKFLEQKLKSVQSDWKSKEIQMMSTHNLAMNQFQHRLEQEARSLKNAINSER